MPFEHLENYGESEGNFRKWLRPITIVLIVVALMTGGIFTGKWAMHHHWSKPAATTTKAKTGNASSAANKPQTNLQAPVRFEPGWYQLQRGDMLSELALRAYGRADWYPIVRANPGLPQDLRTIQAGWWICIPPYRGGKSLHSPRVATATNSTAPTAAKKGTSKIAKPAKATQLTQDLLATLKRSAATAAVSLAVAAPALTTEIDDPPLESMANLPSMKVDITTPRAAETAVGTRRIVNSKPTNTDHRTPKGYAIALPSGMTAALVNRQLETRAYLFQPGEKVAASQHRIGNSEVKVRKGHYVLYVPFKSLPSESQQFNLVVAGLSGPITSEFLRNNGTPVYKHFPVSSHRFAHFLFGTGQDAGSGVIAYAALGPIAGAGAFALTTVIRLARDHHQKVAAENEEAAKDAVFNANLDLERGEQQAALVATSRGQAP